MSSTAPRVDDLTRQIETIDDAIHDLLIKRSEIAAEIEAAMAGAEPILQPAREAGILRRLLSRHRGLLPEPALVRIWREMFGGMTECNRTSTVAVYAPETMPQYWDLARDHFGSYVTMTPFRSTGQVLRAVGESRNTAGVLPPPQDGETDPWWPQLMSADAASPRIIARLPFAGRGNGRGAVSDALVIGRAEPHATGADCSLIAIETQTEMSRARLSAGLAGAGLRTSGLFTHEPQRGSSIILLGFDGTVTRDDPHLQKALESLGDIVTRVVELGGYALPFTDTGQVERKLEAAKPLSSPRPKGGTAGTARKRSEVK